MAKKLVPITQDEMIEAINAEKLGAGHPFETEIDASSKAGKKNLEPGTIGISVTQKGNYMTYCVDENSKLTKTSVHPTQEEAYGMALRRYREYGAEAGIEVVPDEKVEPTFTFTEHTQRVRNGEVEEIEGGIKDVVQADVNPEVNLSQPAPEEVDAGVPNDKNAEANVDAEPSLQDFEAALSELEQSQELGLNV